MDKLNDSAESLLRAEDKQARESSRIPVGFLMAIVILFSLGDAAWDIFVKESFSLYNLLGIPAVGVVAYTVGTYCEQKMAEGKQLRLRLARVELKLDELLISSEQEPRSLREYISHECKEIRDVLDGADGTTPYAPTKPLPLPK